MGSTATTHTFDRFEMEELEDNTGKQGEEALRQWAHHNYPLRTASYLVIGEVEVSEEGSGSIEVVERDV